MFFRFLMLGIAFSVILFICDIFLPRLIVKYRYKKEVKQRAKRQEAFRKKMKELEIK